MLSLRALTLPFFALSLLLPALAAAQPRPVIERIEPASGPVGTEVQLIGRQIHPSSEILIGSTVLPTVRRHPGRWVVRIPEGARSGNVIIRNRFGEFQGPYFRITAARPSPVVRSISPTAGGPGTEVTIEGENFAPRLADNRVTLGNGPVVVRAATPTRLIVVVPSGATSGRFQITVAGAGQTQSDVFSVGASTTVTDLSPRSGPPGTRITLIGTGFASRVNRNRVYLNNRPVRVLSATPTRIEAVIPERAASGAILVDVQGGGRAESPHPFRIQNTPTIESFAPQAAAPGQRIVIRGRSFGRDPRVVQVTLGGRQLTLRRVAPRRIDVDLPAGSATGRLAVTVNGVGPVQSASDLTVLAPVAIADFAPRTGAANTEVRITGAGFSPTPADNEVFIGNSRVEVLSSTATELRFRMTSNRSGIIRVVVPHNGEARSSVPFVLTRPPIVSSFTPTSGGPGTEVRIRGRSFGTAVNLVTVRMGRHRLQVRSVTDGEIVAVIPEGAQSDRLSVSVRLQGVGSSQARFGVMSAFSVSSLAPASTFVGNSIVIRGAGLVAQSTVTFPGVRRPVIGTVVNGGLSVTVPPGARSGALTVRLPDGRTVSTPAFTVTAAPSGVGVTTLEPRCYRPGCEVILRGHGFSSVPNQNLVTFGDRPARVVRASAGSLVVRLPQAPGTNRFKVVIRQGAGGEAESAPFTIVP